MSLRLFILIVILVTALGVAAQTTWGPPAAVVMEFHGSVLLKQGSRQVRLRPGVDVCRELRLGDRIFCEKGAKLTLWMGGRNLELDENSGWFTVRHRSLMADAEGALKAYGRTGGRDRAGFDVPIIYTPANESSVIPDQFAVHWSPLASTCLLSFALRDANDKELWREEGVNGASGSLISASAREALLEYRSKQPAATLQLKLSSSCGEDQIAFTLLSAADEKSLQAKLAALADEKSELPAHVARVAVFNDYEMFAEAATEFEAALRVAPQSRDLLQRTLMAERRIGNRARARQLESRLSKGSTPR